MVLLGVLDSIHLQELSKLFAGEGRAIIGNQLFRKAQCCKAAPHLGNGYCCSRGIAHVHLHPLRMEIYQDKEHVPQERSCIMGVMVLMVDFCDTLGRAHIGLLVLQGQHPGRATTHTVEPETSFSLYLGDHHAVGPGPFLEDLVAQ